MSKTAYRLSDLLRFQPIENIMHVFHCNETEAKAFKHSNRLVPPKECKYCHALSGGGSVCCHQCNQTF